MVIFEYCIIDSLNRDTIFAGPFTNYEITLTLAKDYRETWPESNAVVVSRWIYTSDWSVPELT